MKGFGMTTWKRVVVVVGLFLALSVPTGAEAATWCDYTDVVDVICYSSGECFITATAYGGERYYRIRSDDPNKNQMVSIGLSALLSGKQARLAFVSDSIDCTNVAQNEAIFGVGVVK